MSHSFQAALAVQTSPWGYRLPFLCCLCLLIPHPSTFICSLLSVLCHQDRFHSWIYSNYISSRGWSNAGLQKHGIWSCSSNIVLSYRTCTFKLNTKHGLFKLPSPTPLPGTTQSMPVSFIQPTEEVNTLQPLQQTWYLLYHVNVFPPFKLWAPLPLQWLPDNCEVSEISGSLQWYKYGSISFLTLETCSVSSHPPSLGRSPDTCSCREAADHNGDCAELIWKLIWKPLSYSFKLFHHVGKSCCLSAIMSNQSGVIVCSFWKRENVNGILDHKLSRKWWLFLKISIKMDETVRTLYRIFLLLAMTFRLQILLHNCGFQQSDCSNYVEKHF